jgi:bacillithiol system protein YtxJ
MSEITELMTEADLESALANEIALLYKHSPYCGLSTMARHEVHFFVQGNPDVPVYVVDVIHRRPLSQRIADLFEIEHESPQVILLRRGRPMFDASHRGVSAHAIEAELQRLK